MKPLRFIISGVSHFQGNLLVLFSVYTVLYIHFRFQPPFVEKLLK